MAATNSATFSDVCATMVLRVVVFSVFRLAEFPTKTSSLQEPWRWQEVQQAGGAEAVGISGYGVGRASFAVSGTHFRNLPAVHPANPKNTIRCADWRSCSGSTHCRPESR